MSEGVLVAGVGNIFLRDDGFGPEVVRHLQGAGQTSLPSDVRLVDYGIRGLHLCYDLLEGYQALIIIDALPGNREPGEVTVMSVGPDDLAQTNGSYDPHGMDPVAVLTGLPTIGGTLPPTYVVGARPADLSEGIGLSEPMQFAVPVAVTAVRGLLADRPWLRSARGDDHATAAARKG